jgi:hypothetical protein
MVYIPSSNGSLTVVIRRKAKYKSGMRVIGSFCICKEIRYVLTEVAYLSKIPIHEKLQASAVTCCVGITDDWKLKTT